MTLRCPDCGWAYDPVVEAARRHIPEEQPFEMVPYHYEEPGSSIPCDGTNRTPAKDDGEDS